MRKVRSITLIIITIAAFMVIALASTGDDSPDEPSNESPAVDNSDGAETNVNENEVSDSGNERVSSRFRESLQSVLQYHEDVVTGARSDAELSGAWIAFGLNLRMYSDFERHAYYFAKHGGQSYLREFGEDEYFEEIRELLQAIREENGFTAVFDFGDVARLVPIYIVAGSRNPAFRSDANDVVSFEPISFSDRGLNFTLIGGLWSTRDNVENVSLDLELSEHISVSMAIGFNTGLAERQLGNRDRLLRLYVSVVPGDDIASPRDIPAVGLNVNLVDNTSEESIFVYSSIDREYPTFDSPLYGVLVFGLHSDAEWVDFELGGQVYRLLIDIMPLSE